MLINSENVIMQSISQRERLWVLNFCSNSLRYSKVNNKIFYEAADFLNIGFEYLSEF